MSRFLKSLRRVKNCTEAAEKEILRDNDIKWSPLFLAVDHTAEPDSITCGKHVWVLETHVYTQPPLPDVDRYPHPILGPWLKDSDNKYD